MRDVCVCVCVCSEYVHDSCMGYVFVYMSMHDACMCARTLTHGLFACMSEGAYVLLSVYEVQKTALSVGLTFTLFETGSRVLCFVCKPS